MNSKAEITEKALKMENVFTTQSESALINNDKLTVPGFSNIGNTCYANSILQSLLNTSKLRQFLLRKWNEHKHTDSDILHELKKLANEYWSGQYLVIRPENIINKIQDSNPVFVPWEQQDAHEFLLTTLTMLHEETMIVIKEDMEPIDKINQEIKILQNLCERFSKIQITGGRDLSAIVNFYRHVSKDNKINEKSVGKIINSVLSELKNRLFSAQINLKRLENYQEKIAKNGENGKKPKNNKNVENGKKPKNNKNVENGKNPKNDKNDENDKNPKNDENGKNPKNDKNGKNPKNDENGKNPKNSKNGEKMALNKIIDNFIANPSNSREKRDSIVKDLFHGILIGQVECSRCNRVSQTRSQFSDLSLELPVAQEKSSFLGSIKKFFGDNLPPVTIEECLSHFCKTEGLDEDEMYFCRFCAKKVAAQKRFFFEKVPRTLVIQLKRFASKRHGHDGHGDMTKLRNHVAFPADDLDLSSYLFENKSGNGEGDGQNEAAKTKNTRYSLSSVVVHEGDGHSGHYISYCKNPVTGKWHQMNDRFTKVAKEEDVLSKQAYLLFYERREDEKLIEDNCLFVQKILENKEISGETDENGTKYFLSRQWLQKVMILDDPGPLESRELLCKHAMKTEKICQKSTTDNIFGWHDIAYEITTSQLNALNKRFGNPLTVAKTTLEHDNVGEGKVAPNENCEECEKEKLLRRKKRERNKIISLEKAFKLSKESVTYVVSESWMRAWRCFVNDETNLVPGPIFNEHLLGTDKKMNLDLKIEKDYRVLSKEVWDYLLEIYGGGPEIVNDFISDKDLVK